jgi:hypothetical protein
VGSPAPTLNRFVSRCKYLRMKWEVALQRLFSAFADGWPGLGLLLQRLLTGTVLLYCGISHLGKASQFVPITPHTRTPLRLELGYFSWSVFGPQSGERPLPLLSCGLFCCVSAIRWFP